MRPKPAATQLSQSNSSSDSAHVAAAAAREVAAAAATKTASASATRAAAPHRRRTRKPWPSLLPPVRPLLRCRPLSQIAAGPPPRPQSPPPLRPPQPPPRSGPPRPLAPPQSSPLLRRRPRRLRAREGKWLTCGLEGEAAGKAVGKACALYDIAFPQRICICMGIRFGGYATFPI